MARISQRTPDEVPELSAVFAAGEQLMGFLPNDGLLMAHRPPILRAFLGLVQQIYAPGEVDDGLKRLLGLISSSVAGCRYCQAHAANAARSHEVSIEKIRAVWEFETSPLFTEAERSALRVAVGAAQSPNAVTDEQFAALRSHYSDGQIVEIVSVISMYGFLNRWNLTFQTELEDVPSKVWREANG